MEETSPGESYSQGTQRRTQAEFAPKHRVEPPSSNDKTPETRAARPGCKRLPGGAGLLAVGAGDLAEQRQGRRGVSPPVGPATARPGTSDLPDQPADLLCALVHAGAGHRARVQTPGHDAVRLHRLRLRPGDPRVGWGR